MVGNLHELIKLASSPSDKSLGRPGYGARTKPVSVTETADGLTDLCSSLASFHEPKFAEFLSSQLLFLR